MSVSNSAAAGEGAREEETNARRAAAIALGLDPAAIAWPDEYEERETAAVTPRSRGS
jgi:hypothetical protein